MKWWRAFTSVIQQRYLMIIVNPRTLYYDQLFNRFQASKTPSLG